MTGTRTTSRRVIGALALALLALAAAPARAASLLEGTHEGADFLIGKPDRWNGSLVMFAHGYEGEGGGRGSVRGSPLAGHLTARGYAWAASGYRCRGYRPDRFLADTIRVPFRLEQGYRRRTLAAGTSHLLVQRLRFTPALDPADPLAPRGR